VKGRGSHACNDDGNAKKMLRLYRREKGENMDGHYYEVRACPFTYMDSDICGF